MEKIRKISRIEAIDAVANGKIVQHRMFTQEKFYNISANILIKDFPSAGEFQLVEQDPQRIFGNRLVVKINGNLFLPLYGTPYAEGDNVRFTLEQIL